MKITAIFLDDSSSLQLLQSWTIRDNYRLNTEWDALGKLSFRTIGTFYQSWMKVVTIIIIIINNKSDYLSCGSYIYKVRELLIRIRQNLKSSCWNLSDWLHLTKMYLSIFCDWFKVVIPKLGYFISLRIKLGLRNGRGKMDLRLIAGNLSANKG